MVPWRRGKGQDLLSKLGAREEGVRELGEREGEKRKDTEDMSEQKV